MEEKPRPASQAKLLYHKRKLKTLQSHLERGTIPKTLRLKTFPKMKTPQGQALVHEACDEVQKIMLMQMVEEQRQALAQAQKEYQSLQKPKVDTIKSLRKELKSLRAQLLKLQTPVNTQTSEPEDNPENQLKAQVKHEFGQSRRRFVLKTKPVDTPKQIVNEDSPENQLKAQVET